MLDKLPCTCKQKKSESKNSHSHGLNALWSRQRVEAREILFIGQQFHVLDDMVTDLILQDNVSPLVT